jgi:hypothetical protein
MIHSPACCSIHQAIPSATYGSPEPWGATWGPSLPRGAFPRREWRGKQSPDYPAGRRLNCRSKSVRNDLAGFRDRSKPPSLLIE